MLLHESKNGSRGRHLTKLINDRYSANEIRFNLLAIAQRPLPILVSQLDTLKGLLPQLHSTLNDLVPDWKAFLDHVPANPSQVDSALVEKIIQEADTRDLLALKNAIDRDIALLKTKISNEEEKVSEYLEYVSRRKNDYSAFIRCMLRKLAEKDLIRPLIS